jgi:type I restriction enzyme S subunit
VVSLSRYSEYKDSGVAWLGDMPAHWRVTKTKHVCQFSTGWTPPTGDSSAYEGENLWANISDLGPKILRDTAKRISDSAVVNASIKVSPAGSLLFSFKLSVGQVSIAGVDMYTNEAIATFLESSLLAIGYAYYAFPIFLVKNASENIYGAKLLNQELIRAAFVPLPPRDEQHAIATFLDRETAKIDALIAEQEKLLALLAEKRQATISHAVTRGLNPKALMKDSGILWLGEVPAHWDVRPLKSVLNTPITDGPHETPEFLDEGVPFVSAEAVSGGEINFDKIRGFISEEDEARYATKYRPQLHDIYMVKSGATTGTTAIVDGRTDFNIWSPLAAIRCDQSVALPYFVLQFLRSKNFQEGVALSWSFGTQQNIGMGVLGNLPVLIPPISEQRDIVGYLSEQSKLLDALQEAAESSIPLLRERRSALISAAVTGKIDVRNAAPAKELAA